MGKQIHAFHFYLFVLGCTKPTEIKEPFLERHGKRFVEEVCSFGWGLDDCQSHAKFQSISNGYVIVCYFLLCVFKTNILITTDSGVVYINFPIVNYCLVVKKKCNYCFINTFSMKKKMFKQFTHTHI